MEESAEIPKSRPLEKPQERLLPTEVQPPREQLELKRDEEKIGRLRQELHEAVSTAREEPVAESQNPPNTPISERKPSFGEIGKNLLKDTRIRGFAKMMGGSVGLIAATSITAELTGVAAVDHLTAPLVYGYMFFEFWRSVYGGVRLGEFSGLRRETLFTSMDTPVGRIHAGELIGTLSLMRSVGKMSDLSVKERLVVLPLDGLKGLMILSDKLKDGSKDVKGITAIRASSHLVAQNRELFAQLGFRLQEQSKIEKVGVVSDLLRKVIFVPFWGIRQVLRGNGLRGFKEARALSLGETQTTWTTPKDLTSETAREAIQKQIDRFKPVAQRLLVRKTGGNS